MSGALQLSSLPLPGVAEASSFCHHGEILQGVFSKRNGTRVRALVTLPRVDLGCRAKFRSDPQLRTVLVAPPDRTKAQRAAMLTLKALGRENTGGLLDLCGTIPVGLGCGSSTADVTSAIHATAAAFGRRFSPAKVARLAVEAESASDPLMYHGRTLLFAHREGVVVEDMGPPLPPLVVLSVDTDVSGKGIATDSLEPARYGERDMQYFRPLLGLLRHAVVERSVGLLGRVASASARINQRYLPKPHFDALEHIGERTGASGVQVAHSGTLLGLLFDPSASGLDERLVGCARYVRELGFERVQVIHAGDE